jgi:hypothetical protein
MRSRLWHLLREHIVLAVKCGSAILLLLISALVVACGPNNNAAVPNSPPVTMTINLNQIFASPTAALAPYSCGAWATQTTVAYSPNAVVGVYAKFVQNVNGNPVGMGNASAVAIVYWPNGATSRITETTTSDGLAVFQVPLQAGALGGIVLVEVDFTSSDGQHTCDVTDTQRAFFAVVAATVTTTPNPNPQPSATGGNGTPNPFPSPSPFPTFPGQGTPPSGH